VSEHRLKRKLAAVISADVAGYSRLMADDEVATIRTLMACKAEMAALVTAGGGRVVDFVGDNMLAEFGSTLDAVDHAVKIQRALEKINHKLAGERRMQFRIGIHLGDVTETEERLFGDGVNIAARIEKHADPGGICVSEAVYAQVHNKLDLEFANLGQQTLKNIPDPVTIYRVAEPGHGPAGPPSEAGGDENAALPLPGKPSLAVLPFVNLSADPEQDYFSNGLTLDIMAALVKIPGLFLITDTSLLTFKTLPVSIREISRQFGVNHVLDGGVRKIGNRIRITVRLIKADTGHQVWADQFDRRFEDLFAVEDEIIDEIVTALDVKLVTGKSARTLRKTIKNRDALEYFYRGWQNLFGSGLEHVKEARDMFEETIRLEPESPLGYALAAWSCYRMAELRWFTGDAGRSLEEATQLAQRALALKDLSGLPHLVMGQILLLKREYDSAVAEAEKAVFARPSCEVSYAAKANILLHLGQPEAAVTLARSAIRHSPVYPAYYPAVLAAAYYGCERYEDAVKAAEVVLKTDPNHLDALLFLACAQARLGRLEAARQAAGQALRAMPDFTLKWFCATHPYRERETLDPLLEMLRKAGLDR
jgi:adenylate cyclase